MYEERVWRNISRNERRLNSLDIDLRLLQLLSAVNPDYVSPSIQNLLHTFCTDPLRHTDCDFCLANTVNAFFPVCMWCDATATCTSIQDYCPKRQAETVPRRTHLPPGPSGFAGFTGEEEPPYFFASAATSTICPVKTDRGANAMSCSSISDCRICSMRPDCIWCTSNTTEPILANPDELIRERVSEVVHAFRHADQASATTSIEDTPVGFNLTDRYFEVLMEVYTNRYSYTSQIVREATPILEYKPYENSAILHPSPYGKKQVINI